MGIYLIGKHYVENLMRIGECQFLYLGDGGNGLRLFGNGKTENC
ncbi:hypothetical protein SAMN06265350_1158 [Solitalea koreensis]|uniref:Uncharacterized protein n=1 Tax=Solitalea koreensis TaxID=543615 RepID=A0A521EHG6_9SPHI|nr:hypothetical protein SAMN06265350_1158 [Solitalea koreensis]